MDKQLGSIGKRLFLFLSGEEREEEEKGATRGSNERKGGEGSSDRTKKEKEQ
jgi:hypothetical protein